MPGSIASTRIKSGKLGTANFAQTYRKAAQVVDPRFAARARTISGNSYQQAQLANIQGSFEQWKLLAASAIVRHADNSVRDSEEYPYRQALQRKASMDKISVIAE